MSKRIANSRSKPDKAFRQRTKEINLSVREAIERHAKLGESVAIMKNGKVEVVPAASLIKRRSR